MTRFEIHPDVARARTIHKDFYLDPQVFEAARERVFARHWWWIGPGALEPGSLAPITLHGQPMLLARDDAGTLRCLSNVCTHRGKILVEAPCRARDIRCGYHSRRFDFGGRMTFMPGFEGAQDFPGPDDHLASWPLQQWRGHAFVAADPALPLGELLAPVQARLHWLPIETWQPDPARSRDYEFDAHWALYVENYLEGLHIRWLHPGLAGTLDLADYRYELHPFATLQLGLAKPGEPAFEPPPSSPEHGQRIAAYYWWLFPNLMLNVYPWGLSVNRVEPLSPTRTRVCFRSFVADPARLGQGAGGALDQVELEDEAAVVSVQQGLASRHYRNGRYSPQHEAGVHHFHRMLAEAMG